VSWASTSRRRWLIPPTVSAHPTRRPARPRCSAAGFERVEPSSTRQRHYSPSDALPAAPGRASPPSTISVSRGSSEARTAAHRPRLAAPGAGGSAGARCLIRFRVPGPNGCRWDKHIAVRIPPEKGNRGGLEVDPDRVSKRCAASTDEAGSRCVSSGGY